MSAEEFYQNHRGGSGAVVVVQAFEIGRNNPIIGIFGSIETARSWVGTFGSRYTCLFSPYIVDDPDWGNETPPNQEPAR